MIAMMTDSPALTMGEAALRGGAVVLAAGAAVALLRIRSAARRSAIWKGALVASVLMPAAMLAAPPVFLRTAAAAPAPTTIAPDFTLPQATSAATPSVFTPAADVAVPAEPFDWISAVYLCGLGVMLARLALGLALGARLVAGARRIDVGAAFETRESRRVAAPTTFGWPRAVVLLPEAWKFWDEKKLAAVLLHEGAHVARGDFLVNALAQINVALFWFSPFAWMLKARLARAGEEASDDRALDAFGDNAAYADILLGFATRSAPRFAAPVAAPMAEGMAAARIERALEHEPGASRALGPVARALLVGATLALAWGAAAVSLAEGPARAPAPPAFLAAPQPAAPVSSPKPPLAPSAPAKTRSPAPLPPSAPEPPAPASAPAAPELLGGPDAPSAPTPPDVPDTDDKDRDNWSWSWNDDGKRTSRLFLDKDRIEFEKDGERWVVTDADALKRVNEALRAQFALEREQERLEKEADRLSDEQDAMGDRQDAIKVDATRLRARLGEEMAALQKLTAKSEITQDELGEIQDRLGELQGELGEMQARAGTDQSRLASIQSGIAARQAALGAKQSELGRRMGEVSTRIEKQVSEIVEDALRDGKARRDD